MAKVARVLLRCDPASVASPFRVTTIGRGDPGSSKNARETRPGRALLSNDAHAGLVGLAEGFEPILDQSEEQKRADEQSWAETSYYGNGWLNHTS